MGIENGQRAAEQRGVWTAIIVISGVMVAFGAGLLAHAAGLSIPNAVLTGGSAFAGAVAVLLALWYFATGRST